MAKERVLSRILTGTACAVALSIGIASVAEAKVRMRLQTAFNPNLSVIGEASKNLTDNITRMSNGEIEIRFYEAGKLVPTFEMFDAVKAGNLDASYGWPGYIMGKIPAITMFASVPFGPTTAEYMAWMQEGDGGKLFQEIYAQHGIHAMLCGMIGAEASGWFRNEIKSVEDLRGLKVRYAGLGGEVMSKLGASVTVLAAGEIFPNLERGVIDATEFSMPSIDKALGFYKIIKNYYFPGWHQPASTAELIINKRFWDSLPAHNQAQIEVACKANIAWEIARGDGEQAKALEDLQAEGVTLRTWPPEMMDAFRKATDEVMAEQSAKDADFKRIYENQRDYIARVRSWIDLGVPK
ncbi:MAG: TRAP transporter substrate-binding protein [Alphaproteobacteria bacterium]